MGVLIHALVHSPLLQSLVQTSLGLLTIPLWAHLGPYVHIVAHIHTHVCTPPQAGAHPPDLGKSQHVMTWWDNLDMSDTG